jgi:hypothetical protein
MGSTEEGEARVLRRSRRGTRIFRKGRDRLDAGLLRVEILENGSDVVGLLGLRGVVGETVCPDAGKVSSTTLATVV